MKDESAGGAHFILHVCYSMTRQMASVVAGRAGSYTSFRRDAPSPIPVHALVSGHCRYLGGMRCRNRLGTSPRRKPESSSASSRFSSNGIHSPEDSS